MILDLASSIAEYFESGTFGLELGQSPKNLGPKLGCKEDDIWTCSNFQTIVNSSSSVFEGEKRGPIRV